CAAPDAKACYAAVVAPGHELDTTRCRRRNARDHVPDRVQGEMRGAFVIEGDVTAALVAFGIEKQDAAGLGAAVEAFAERTWLGHGCADPDALDAARIDHNESADAQNRVGLYGGCRCRRLGREHSRVRDYLNGRQHSAQHDQAAYQECEPPDLPLELQRV